MNSPSAKTPMEIDECMRIFFEMETEERLFLLRTPDGTPIWDLVRYEVFFSLFDELNEPGQPRNSYAAQVPSRRYSAVVSLLSKAVSTTRQWLRFKRLKPVDHVAFIVSRYRNRKNEPVDFAADDALRALDDLGSVLKVDSQPDLYADLNIASLTGVIQRLYPLAASYKEYFLVTAERLAEAQRKHFCVADPNLSGIVQRVYMNHAAQRRIWGEILDRARPRLLWMTQNGVQKGLILEARKRGIPVIEFQHCSINPMHPTYSYPAGLLPQAGVILPDVLLLFSEHWKRTCTMPGTRLVAVGNDCFSSGETGSTRNGATVFVNHGIFHKHFSPLAIEVAQAMPEREFVMKLHPSQLPDRAGIEAEYRGISNLTVMGMEKSMPEVLADASDIVIIDSTSAYEALDRDVPVHIYQRGPYRAYQDIFARPDVCLFSTAQQLQRGLFQPVTRPEVKSRFFDPFNLKAFRNLVLELERGRGETAP